MGLESVDLDAFGTVRFVDYDFVQGQVMREGPQENELWYGLGVVVTGSELRNADWPRHYAAPEVYAGLLELPRNATMRFRNRSVTVSSSSFNARPPTKRRSSISCKAH